MLSVEDLWFGYPGGTPVLRGASLRLEPGLAVGLLGANGSGKSTLLGAVTDSIEGKREGLIKADPDAAGPIGYATQDVALYQHLTVAENLTHAARLATRRWRIADLVEQAVDDFDLDALRDRPARFLSGGQRRLVHLACAFVHRPAVRLLDEPTTALDFETRQKLIGLVGEWRAQDVAILVTAHYPEDVEELCSSITVLSDGRTYDLGPLGGYLARQRRLGYVEHVTDDGAVKLTELHSPLGSIDDLQRAAAEAGIGGADALHSVQVKAPSLRDLLRRDPSLRAAVAEDPR
ncbi:ATP-binding cassette domain-containing protein [Actinomadura sp. 9N215]|uniref:ATP-binding cassette domain-containing protein n=1 Tax=Actinomadura sp. 9N215 TaxID=3375150 RepID=UPI0037B80D19